MPDMIAPEVQPQLPYEPPRSRHWSVIAGVGLGVVIVGSAAMYMIRSRSAVVQHGLSSTSSETVQVVNTPRVDSFPEDADRDGISNVDEQKMGLNERDIDTDGDGISDYDEIYVWKTDPKKGDTDGDGYLDGVEIFTGNNPTGIGKLQMKP